MTQTSVSGVLFESMVALGACCQPNHCDWKPSLLAIVRRATLNALPGGSSVLVSWGLELESDRSSRNVVIMFSWTAN